MGLTIAFDPVMWQSRPTSTRAWHVAVLSFWAFHRSIDRALILFRNAPTRSTLGKIVCLALPQTLKNTPVNVNSRPRSTTERICCLRYLWQQNWPQDRGENHPFSISDFAKSVPERVRPSPQLHAYGQVDRQSKPNQRRRVNVHDKNRR